MGPFQCFLFLTWPFILVWHVCWISVYVSHGRMTVWLLPHSMRNFEFGTVCLTLPLLDSRYIYRTQNFDSKLCVSWSCVGLFQCFLFLTWPVILVQHACWISVYMSHGRMPVFADAQPGTRYLVCFYIHTNHKPTKMRIGWCCRSNKWSVRTDRTRTGIQQLAGCGSTNQLRNKKRWKRLTDEPGMLYLLTHNQAPDTLSVSTYIQITSRPNIPL